MGDQDQLTQRIIGAAIEVHKALGPGLLERVYEEALCMELFSRGIGFERQVEVPVIYKGTRLAAGFRLDLLVEKVVIVEVKSKEVVIHSDMMQTLTYLRLSGLELGLLMNFNCDRLVDGVQRVVNQYGKKSVLDEF